MTIKRKLFIVSTAFLIILFFAIKWKTIDGIADENVIDDDYLKNCDFCVIASYFNPASYTSRYVLYKRFEQHMSRFKVRLITIELAINNQTFQVTNPQNPNHIQMRTNDVLWYKENLINIAFKRNRHVCKYVAWIDLEVEFLNENWVEDTIAALGMHKVVQMFEIVRILGEDSEVSVAQAGYSRCFNTKKDKKFATYKELMEIYNQSKLNKGYCASGYAWAINNNAFEAIGGLFDRCILGDSDYIAVKSFVGSMLHSFYKSSHLTVEVMKWQLNSFNYINKSVGYVNGRINHLFHGSRKNRNYNSRRAILNSYNPNADVYYDSNDLLHYTKTAKAIYEQRIKDYFISRQEDF